MIKSLIPKFLQKKTSAPVSADDEAILLTEEISPALEGLLSEENMREDLTLDVQMIKEKYTELLEKKLITAEDFSIYIRALKERKMKAPKPDEPEEPEIDGELAMKEAEVIDNRQNLIEFENDPASQDQKISLSQGGSKDWRLSFNDGDNVHLYSINPADGKISTAVAKFGDLFSANKPTGKKGITKEEASSVEKKITPLLDREDVLLGKESFKEKYAQLADVGKIDLETAKRAAREWRLQQAVYDVLVADLSTEKDFDVSKLEVIPGMLHVEIAIGRIKNGLAKSVADNLEKYDGICDMENVARAFAETPVGLDLLAFNLHKYVGNLEPGLAKKMIEAGHGRKILENINLIDENFHAGISSQLLEQGLVREIGEKYFTFKELAPEVVAELVKIGTMDAVTAIKYSRTLDDKVAMNLAKTGNRAFIEKHFSKIEIFSIDMIKTMLENGLGDIVGENLDRIPGKMHLRIAKMMLDMDQVKIVVEYINSFEGFDRETSEMIKRFPQWSEFRKKASLSAMLSKKGIY